MGSHGLPEFGQRQLGSKSRYGLQLVEGAAGIPHTPIGNRGNRDAGGGGDRRGDQSDLVSHSACRVLVNFRLRDIAQVYLPAALQHGRCKGGRFGGAETVAGARHQKGAHLIVLDFAPRITTDELLKLFEGNLFAICLAAD